ncbi:hypothetical protein bthur0005_62470 [Bacillus thuringiensis serovar pakistani str. T13001]|nr:hypothetical protein bthur0005_62470 [Bacillus thuringiensis serovar pakistani str. T13001]
MHSPFQRYNLLSPTMKLILSCEVSLANLFKSPLCNVKGISTTPI